MYQVRPPGCVVKRNLRTTDDWLIRIGYLILVGSLLASGCSDSFDSQGVGPIGQLLVFSAALVTLTVGYSLRRDERKITQVWNILEHSAEVHIDELSHATGFSKQFFARAVRMINGQPDTLRMGILQLAPSSMAGCGRGFTLLSNVKVAVRKSMLKCL